MSRGAIVALVLVVVAAAAAVFGWMTWQRYTQSPHYATVKAVQSMSDRDWQEFQRWVDVGQVVHKAVQDQAGGGSVPPGVEQQARGLLEQRVTAGIRGVPANVPFAALWFSGVVHSTKTSPDTASATVSSTSGGRSVTLDLKLKLADGEWKVVEVGNAADLLRQGL